MNRARTPKPKGSERHEGAPRVTVISNFYDAEDYFVEAIESVLAQDYRDFELILVDDGSTDSSRAIADDFAARDPARVRCLQHPGRANRGRSAARNLGLEHARGEFVAFIDADDRWAPDKLLRQLQFLEAFPNADAVCGSVNYWRSWAGGADRIVPTGHATDRVVEPPEALLNWYPLGRADAPSLSDLLMRISAVRAAGGFEAEFPSAYDDQAFLSKFYRRSGIYVSSDVLSDYRLHDRSCMATVVSAGRYHEFRSRFLEWFEDYLIRAGEDQDAGILAAVRRARFSYTHPVIGKPARAVGKALRRLGFA